MDLNLNISNRLRNYYSPKVLVLFYYGSMNIQNVHFGN